MPHNSLSKWQKTVFRRPRVSKVLLSKICFCSQPKQPFLFCYHLCGRINEIGFTPTAVAADPKISWEWMGMTLRLPARRGGEVSFFPHHDHVLKTNYVPKAYLENFLNKFLYAFPFITWAQHHPPPATLAMVEVCRWGGPVVPWSMTAKSASQNDTATERTRFSV